MLQQGHTLKDHMQTGYVYLILADKVTCDFLKSAMEAYEAQRWRKIGKHGNTRKPKMQGRSTRPAASCKRTQVIQHYSSA